MSKNSKVNWSPADKEKLKAANELKQKKLQQQVDKAAEAETDKGAANILGKIYGGDLGGSDIGGTGGGGGY